jgi:MFS family permease
MNKAQLVTDAHAPVTYRTSDFRLFIFGRFFSTTSMQVQSVAIGWQIYAISQSTLALGLVGLCQFLPMFLFTLPAGDLSDRLDQRRVYGASLAVQGLCSAMFLALTAAGIRDVRYFYGVLALFGAARGFSGPSGQSLIAFLVSPEKLARSIAASSSAFTTAVIAGPALGGFLYALGPISTYSVCVAGYLAAAVIMVNLGGRRRAAALTPEVSGFERVAEGIRFVRARPVVLGAISLDLFAVLLGGAVALLPVYARDILHVGPIGLGFLRSAPAAGSALVALSFAYRPLERHAGAWMFACVAIFGLSTIVFGRSTSFYLSLAALFVLGASDMVSVFVRSALIQFATPDRMRGRVSAVNMLFIGGSNELGEFESGVTAAWFGTVPAVIVGGLGTLGIVGIWMWLFPPLLKVDRLMDVADT